MADQKTFDFFEHTADIGLRAFGATLPEMFANAGLGLMSLMVDMDTAQPGGIRERVRAEGPDRETLLVNWLNEVIFLYSVQKLVFVRFRVLSLTDTAVEAEGEGELFDPGRHGTLREVKAATLHELAVKKTDKGFWEARVVLDV